MKRRRSAEKEGKAEEIKKDQERFISATLTPFTPLASVSHPADK